VEDSETEAYQADRRARTAAVLQAFKAECGLCGEQRVAVEWTPPPGARAAVHPFRQCPTCDVAVR